MKKLLALLLLSLLCGVAQAEITVEVDWVDGEECYVAVKTDPLSFALKGDTMHYETADGLVWQAAPIPFPMLEHRLMPQSEAEVRRMNGLYAALQNASGFWHTYGTLRGTHSVFSAPDEASYRGANGKAKVVLSDGAWLLMEWDGWSLIEYKVSGQANRIGWIHTNCMGSAPVMFTEIEVALAEEAFLTDDPAKSWREIARGEELSDVRLLAQRDAFWGYVSAKLPDGRAVWGFVPLRCIVREDAVDRDMMRQLAGEWAFCGGGELIGEVFTLAADGAITFWRITDEELMSMSYLTEGLKERVASSQATWAVVTGTNGYAWDFLLSHDDGRQERFHLYDNAEGTLTLTQGEAGGFWQRLDK